VQKTEKREKREKTGNALTAVMLLLLVLVSQGLNAQQRNTEDVPSWILMERGKAAFAEGELGQALFYFQETLRKKDLIGEGYTWTGRVYEAEGEYHLAEQAYRNAISEERSFYIWEERFTPRNLLAAVLEKQGKSAEAVPIYQDIISMNAEADPASLPAVFLLDNFLDEEKGPDKFLELYRPSGAQTIAARAALGRIFLDRGDLQGAMENLLLSVMVPLSMTIDVFLSREPGYRFISDAYGYGNTLELLKKAAKDEQVSNFLHKTDIYGNIYRFAMALKRNGNNKRAKELITMLTELNEAGRWRLLAEEELAGLL
jgi:tetratricopeptide (TPR) repeat protein